jgi:hypothetical protein
MTDQQTEKKSLGCFYGIVTIVMIGLIFFIISVSDKQEKLSRCTAASQEQINWVNDGVRKISSDYYITSGYTVKSVDFENVYFFGATIQGPGASNLEPVMFAIGGNKDDPNITLAVNQTARAYSGFPSSDEMYDLLGVSEYADGYEEAKFCAEQYK